MTSIKPPLDIASITSLQRNTEFSLKGKKGVGADEAAKAAEQFEGLLLHQMLQSMWKTVPKNELFGSSTADDFFNDMFQEALSTSISEGRGIGVKEVLERELKKLEKISDENASKE